MFKSNKKKLKSEWKTLATEFDRLYNEVSLLLKHYQDMKKQTNINLNVNLNLEWETNQKNKVAKTTYFEQDDKIMRKHKNSIEEFNDYKMLTIARLESLRFQYQEIKKFYYNHYNDYKNNKDQILVSGKDYLKLFNKINICVVDQGKKLNEIVSEWNKIDPDSSCFYEKKQQDQTQTTRTRSREIGSSFEQTFENIKKIDRNLSASDDSIPERKTSCILQ